MAVSGPPEGHLQVPKPVTLVESDGRGHFCDRLGIATLVLKLPCRLQAML